MKALTVRFLWAAALLAGALSCHGVEMEIVNVTGTNCIVIQTNGGSRVWWVAVGQSAWVEGSLGTIELRPSWVGSPTSVYRTVSNGCTRVVLMRDVTGYVPLCFPRQLDAEVNLGRYLEWLAGGFAAGLVMLTTGWGYRIIRGAVTETDPEP